VLLHHAGAEAHELGADDFDGSEFGQDLSRSAMSFAEAPIEARVRFIDAAKDYLIAGVSARRLDRAEGGVASFDAPLVLEPDAAEAMAQRILADRALRRRRCRSGLGPRRSRWSRAIACFVEWRRGCSRSCVSKTQMRASLNCAARAPCRRDYSGGVDPGAAQMPQAAPTPAFAILDLPPLPNDESDDRPLAAVFASPWLRRAFCVCGRQHNRAAPLRPRRRSWAN
jgi:hypothetical protein